MNTARTVPDLQALVLAHGTYDRITPQAWARFDREMARWKDLVRNNEGKTK